MSVRPSAWNNSVPTGRIFTKFEIRVFFFLKTVENNLDSLKSDKNNRHFTWRPIYISDHISHNSSYGDRFLDKSCREKSKDPIGCSTILSFFSKIELLKRLEKCYTDEQATDDNIIRRMLDNWGYKHTLRIHCRQLGYHPSRTAHWLQHTAIQEQYSQCGSSTT